MIKEFGVENAFSPFGALRTERDLMWQYVIGDESAIDGLWLPTKQLTAKERPFLSTSGAFVALLQCQGSGFLSWFIKDNYEAVRLHAVIMKERVGGGSFLMFTEFSKDF